MNKEVELKNYLIENNIPFFEGESGALSITISDLPKDVLNAYSLFCYNLQEKHKELEKLKILLHGIE